MTARLAPLLVVLGAAAATAWANDRLPPRLRAPYREALEAARAYADFVLTRVYGAAWAAGRGARGEALDDSVDEAVHLILPHARRLTQDTLSGTATTHLRFTRPDRRDAVLRAALAAQSRTETDPLRALRRAVAKIGRTADRALEQRIEQALAEDLEDHVQRGAEALAAQAVRGRPRSEARPLPEQEERRYRKRVAIEAHRQAYYWLRKKRRLALASLAASHTQAELDRLRHQGEVWALASGITHAAWERNRLRMDFAWGRFGWEILRRRIRRRLDQDLARGVWSLAKLVREIGRPDVQRRAAAELQKQVRSALGTGALREMAGDYPRSANRLRRALEPALDALAPIWDRAMSRVKLPADIDALAREHGRRWAREEMRGALGQVIQHEAAGHAALRAVLGRLPEWVALSLARFDPGRATERREIANRAHRQVARDVAPRIDRAVEASLRSSGLDDLLWTRAGRGRAVRRVWRDHSLTDRVRDETERQMSEDRRF